MLHTNIHVLLFETFKTIIDRWSSIFYLKWRKISIENKNVWIVTESLIMKRTKAKLFILLFGFENRDRLLWHP